MTLSPNLRAALNAEETDQEIVCLLTISHPNFTEPMRVTDSPVTVFDDDVYGIDSRGDRFIYIPFNFTMPDQNDTAVPTVRLSVENVSLEITEAFKKMTSPAICLFELVLASSPDTLEMVYEDLILRGGQGDVLYVSADVAADDVTRERYPADSYSPFLYPGLFS